MGVERRKEGYPGTEENVICEAWERHMRNSNSNSRRLSGKVTKVNTLSTKTRLVTKLSWQDMNSLLRAGQGKTQDALDCWRNQAKGKKNSAEKKSLVHASYFATDPTNPPPLLSLTLTIQETKGKVHHLYKLSARPRHHLLHYIFTSHIVSSSLPIQKCKKCEKKEASHFLL